MNVLKYHIIAFYLGEHKLWTSSTQYTMIVNHLLKHLNNNSIFHIIGACRDIPIGIFSFVSHSINTCCFCCFCSIFNLATVENRGTGRKNFGIWCLEDLQVYTA